jgi:hypothetical protein
MTIPVSNLVKINPGVLAAAGAAVDANGVFLTNNPYVPIGTYVSFTSATDVGSYFGLSSTEYALAQIYFSGFTNCTKTPGAMIFTQYPSSAVSAYLRGASLAGMTLSQLQALSGTLSVTIDGTVVSASSINLTGVTSFSAAAALITTALGHPVTYDSTKCAFIISSSTTGTASTIGFASGTLAASLLLTSATGAVTSQGAAAATPNAFMSAFVLETQNWVAFTTVFEPVTADKIAFSAWTSAQNERYMYVGYDSDINATVSGSTTTWGYALQQNNYNGSFPIYGNNTHAALILGITASIDWDRKNGRITYAFRQNANVSPSVTNASVAANLITNGYNYFGAYATAKNNWNIVYPGSISGEYDWADSYVNQIYLNAQLQLAMVTLLLEVNSIPYDTDGYALVDAACLDPINAAINFGTIRKGVSLSSAQIAEIKYAIGTDVSQNIITQGFYLQIVDATAAIRSARTSPSMTLYYSDGGSIQQLNLASIEIQ